MTAGGCRGGPGGWGTRDWVSGADSEALGGQSATGAGGWFTRQGSCGCRGDVFSPLLLSVSSGQSLEIQRRGWRWRRWSWRIRWRKHGWRGSLRGRSCGGGWCGWAGSSRQDTRGWSGCGAKRSKCPALFLRNSYMSVFKYAVSELEWTMCQQRPLTLTCKMKSGLSLISDITHTSKRLRVWKYLFVQNVQAEALQRLRGDVVLFHPEPLLHTCPGSPSSPGADSLWCGDRQGWRKKQNINNIWLKHKIPAWMVPLCVEFASSPRDIVGLPCH